MLSKLEIIQQKIMSLEHLKRLVNQWHLTNKKIVFTNGCFDIMHEGHNTYLLQAAELGNKLIVALNTDKSVAKLKGENRPVINEQARALNLATNTYVDAVILFDEDTPLHLIEALKPDVLTKGGDYTENQVVGADVVKANGGEVVILPLVEGASTSNIIDKILSTK